MRFENRQKLQKPLDEIQRQIDQLIILEQKQLIEDMNVLNKKNNELKQTIRLLESKHWDFAKYKAYYYTMNGHCPSCDGEGGFDAGEDSHECDTCGGTGDISMQKIQKIIYDQIEESIKKEGEKPGICKSF